jgi:phosphate-selective porin OprO/OprP
MRVAKWLMGAVLCCTLSVATAPARAQVSYVPAADQQMVTISQSNFDEIMGRLTSLESAMLADEGYKPNGGWEEVDTISKPTIKVSGRLHLDYWAFPESADLVSFLDGSDPLAGPDDMIGFRRLRFGFKGNVNETMLYKIEMDFATAADGSFKDAYLGWTELPLLQTLLVGQQKRPYGLDHLNSSRFNVFMERPYVIEAFNQDARRIGLCSYGTTENERWNWRFGCFELDDLARSGVQYTDNYQVEAAGRLANTIWYDEVSDGRGYAHWAVSGTAAFPGDGPDARFATRPEARTRGKWFDTGQIAGCQTYQLLGLEGVLNLGSLAVVGEYQTIRAQRSNADDLVFGGGYVYVAWFLTGEHQPWELYSGTIGRVTPLENFFRVRRCSGGCGHGLGAWQVAARYSHGDFSDQDIFGGVGDSVTFGLNWWWNPYARLQFNAIYGSIAEREFANAPSTSGDYTIFGTRFMCDF